MNGLKIIIKSIIVMLLIAVVFVPVMSLGYCAIRVSTLTGYSGEENRELMCEECFDSAWFASELLGCNREILEEQRYYNEYKQNNE